ncbi:Protection of telomeres protein 1 [Oryzias melastigma]|uniref:Protection of telomeres protein 1 n=1 Tax=Oryzias melastigma TaxID=30732 RepID=A0A834BPU1_ORYME|nr:Protection of telomeres protein 1 [Oryzias melastigma]
MPFHAVVDGARPGVQVPQHLTRIPINLISTSSDLTNAIVKGKVLRKGPLVSATLHDFLLKAVIQEEDSQPSSSAQINAINIVLFGELAKNFSEGVSPGDVVMASGFTVSKSPTASKDKLHPLHLLLSQDANIYCFSQSSSLNPRSAVDSKRRSTVSAEVLNKTKVPKYTYTRLGDLKSGNVVNVYGVVVFFKQPFKSHGTDFCSSLKITDQSNRNVSCTIFCEKLEQHPKIFQIGDIVRMHRVKVKLFNNAITLVNTFGFSVITFDGKSSGTVEPRTSSRTFHFDEQDRKTVEELQKWISTQNVLPASPASVTLSAIQPKAYFDLTCQLLAKATIDTTCTLLRVWDGTRSPNTFVSVDLNDVEGPTSFSREKESFIANILVYDNHSMFAKQLKLGAFLRIYNLRAVPVSSKVRDINRNQAEAGDHLALHLHGGTSFGRGIRVLPENSPDVEKLKRAIAFLTEDVEDFTAEPTDLELHQVWSTPPEFLEDKAETNSTCSTSAEGSCRPQQQQVTLSQLKQSTPGQVYHVRAQLRSYEPSKLHQALKLFCSKCSSIQDIPDDELLATIFSDASKNSENCSLPKWAVPGRIELPSGSTKRAVRFYVSPRLKEEGKPRELLFIRGTTLEETCHLAQGYKNIVPVTSSESCLALMDLSSPFLFRGPRRYYGCKQCSKATLSELPSLDKLLDEKIIAEALGVQLLKFVLLMKLQLQDATDTLEVFLWKHAELFLGVSAEEVAISQEAQNSVHATLESLCPTKGAVGLRPWLDLSLISYWGDGEEGQKQTCYQICSPPISRPSSGQSEHT